MLKVLFESLGVAAAAKAVGEGGAALAAGIRNAVTGEGHITTIATINSRNEIAAHESNARIAEAQAKTRQAEAKVAERVVALREKELETQQVLSNNEKQVSLAFAENERQKANQHSQANQGNNQILFYTFGLAITVIVAITIALYRLPAQNNDNDNLVAHRILDLAENGFKLVALLVGSGFLFVLGRELSNRGYFNQVSGLFSNPRLNNNNAPPPQNGPRVEEFPN